MKVLYVNHTSRMSGAEQSLLELLTGLPYEVDPVVACPEGELAEEIRSLAIPVVTLTGTGVSFRLHPWHTPWGLAQIGAAAAHLRRIAHAFDARLVHANSIRSGLFAGLTASAGGPPTIVHVRDCMPAARTADLVRGFLRPRVAAVFANSSYTAANFMGEATRPPVRVVYNAVDLERFDPNRISREAARTALGIAPDVLAVGVVSQITPWKAQDDAIRVIASLRRSGLNARLLVVGDAKFVLGSIRYDNEAYERSLRTLVRQLGVQPYVDFLGDRRDVPEILRALDLVLVPSWEEPFGRVVIEAMAMRIPVVATNVGGPREILRDQGAGLLLPPREPQLWAREAALLLADSDQRAAMGEQGRQLVTENFTRAAHVREVLNGYGDVLAGARNGRVRDAGNQVVRRR